MKMEDEIDSLLFSDVELTDDPEINEVKLNRTKIFFNYIVNKYGNKAIKYIKEKHKKIKEKP